MKRKLLYLLSLLTTSGMIVACGGGGVVGGDSSDGGDKGSSGGENAIKLPNTMEEAANKFYQLGQRQGFEITVLTIDDETNVRETNTIGFKNDVLWIKESSAYKRDGTNLETYNYDEQNRYYDFQGSIQETANLSFDSIIKNLTASFYIGYEYANYAELGSFTSSKSTTYLSRPATEYVFSYKALDGQADFNIIFDNETGITLKVSGTATVTGSETSSSTYEITSFVVGNAVAMPTLHKGNGGGEGGEGGETQTDVFSNRLLMYVSNQNASLYVGSQLGLFADGTFELKFTQDGYVVVIFGNYTVADSKGYATLTTTRVYKDQGKQTSTMNETWLLSYADNAYTLNVSKNGTVFFNAAGGEPSHYVIPGEGGQIGDVENFVNHFFTYVSQQNAEAFINSTVALFDDATFEVVTTQNGSLFVYMGQYTVNTSDTAATLSVTKTYSAASGAYTNQLVGNWLFTLQREGYALAMAGGPTVIYALSNQAPTHADIPEEGQQTGDDAKYKITSAQWETMIYDSGLVSMTSNFSAEVYTTDNPNGQAKYAFDNGKIRYEYTDATSGSESYYEYESDTKGYMYYQDNYGTWMRGDMYVGIQSFGNSLGLLPIHFDEMTYDSINHCYGRSSWTDQYGSDSYERPRFYFEDEHLVKITYTHWNVNFTYMFYGYGTTTVRLPEIGSGGNHPTQEQLNALVKNNVYVYSSAVDNTHEYEYADKFDEMFNGDTISFFDDGTFEMNYPQLPNFKNGTVDNWQYCIIGTYQVKEATASNPDFNQVMMYPTKAVINGILFDQEDWSDISGSVILNPSENKITVSERGGDVTTYYVKDASRTPTHIEYTEVGGDETESKWPADQITAQLKQLELNVQLPAPYNKDENIVSVTNEVVDGSLKIVITLTSTYNAMMEQMYYLGFENEDFPFDYLNSDYDNGVYVYTNKTKNVLITISCPEGSSAVTIIVSKYEASLLPAEAIARYFSANGVEATFPDITISDVSYGFNDQSGILTITPEMEGMTSASVIANTGSKFIEAGFKIMYVDSGSEEDPLMPIYFDPTGSYYVFMMEGFMTEGEVWLFIQICEEATYDEMSFTYPADAINDAFSDYELTDSIPNLAVNGATYKFGWNEDSYELDISMQPDMNADRIARELGVVLTRANYKLEDGNYYSPNGEFSISIDIIDGKLIRVMITCLVEVVESVQYILVCDNNWNIFADDAQLYAYVWKENGEVEWIELYPEESGNFIITIDSDWEYLIIVRFASDSEIGWSTGAEDENITIYNQTDDIKLSGYSSEVHFSLRG